MAEYLGPRLALNPLFLKNVPRRRSERPYSDRGRAMRLPSRRPARLAFSAWRPSAGCACRWQQSSAQRFGAGLALGPGPWPRASRAVRNIRPSQAQSASWMSVSRVGQFSPAAIIPEDHARSCRRGVPTFVALSRSSSLFIKSWMYRRWSSGPFWTSAGFGAPGMTKCTSLPRRIFGISETHRRTRVTFHPAANRRKRSKKKVEHVRSDRDLRSRKFSDPSAPA
jgi:hypothetical protein